jgi:hypothetical protein
MGIRIPRGPSSHDRQLLSELDRQRIEAIYTKIPRARKTLPSTAMLAQIAGQARGLMGRSGLVGCVERAGIAKLHEPASREGRAL